MRGGGGGVEITRGRGERDFNCAFNHTKHILTALFCISTLLGDKEIISRVPKGV